MRSQGRVAELADALDLGSSGVTRGGSSPLSPTIYIAAERRFSFWGSLKGFSYRVLTAKIRLTLLSNPLDSTVCGAGFSNKHACLDPLGHPKGWRGNGRWGAHTTYKKFQTQLTVRLTAPQIRWLSFDT